jgi:hypothetical protein
MNGDDKDDIETTLISPSQAFDEPGSPRGELTQALDDLETLLKNGDVIAALTQRGINASIALLAVDGLRNYVAGRKMEGAGDFAAAAEEIRGRLALSDTARGGPPGQ